MRPCRARIAPRSCRRLIVVIGDSDRIAEHFVAHGRNGVDTMARGKDGWCIALDRINRCCSIYAERPRCAGNS